VYPLAQPASPGSIGCRSNLLTSWWEALSRAGINPSTVAFTSPSFDKRRVSLPHGHTVSIPRTPVCYNPCTGLLSFSTFYFCTIVSVVSALHGPPFGFSFRRASTLRHRTSVSCFTERMRRRSANAAWSFHRHEVPLYVPWMCFVVSSCCSNKHAAWTLCLFSLQVVSTPNGIVAVSGEPFTPAMSLEENIEPAAPVVPGRTWAALMQPRDSVASRNGAVRHWVYDSVTTEGSQHNVNPISPQRINTLSTLLCGHLLGFWAGRAWSKKPGQDEPSSLLPIVVTRPIVPRLEGSQAA